MENQKIRSNHKVPGLRICKGCGANIPIFEKGDKCVLCDTPVDEPPLIVPPPKNDFHYIQLLVNHKCNFCGVMAPINGVISSGTIICTNCGSKQMQNTNNWSVMYNMVHDAADMAEPFGRLRDINDEVRANRLEKYSNTCKTRPFTYIADREGFGETVTIIKASPGNPVCKSCQLPLEIIVNHGVTTTTCPGCGQEKEYSMPPNMTPDMNSLVGVIIENSTNSDDDPSNEVKVLSCPSCGASLHSEKDKNSINCPYCGAELILPKKNRREISKGELNPSPWWMIFKGNSPGRSKLEQRKRPEKHYSSGNNNQSSKEEIDEIFRQAKEYEIKSKAKKQTIIKTAITIISVIIIVIIFLIVNGQSG